MEQFFVVAYMTIFYDTSTVVRRVSKNSVNQFYTCMFKETTIFILFFW